MDGWVYLLCFDRPYKHARHYVGWAKDLEGRLAYHGGPGGANLMRVVKDSGGTWTLVRKVRGTRMRERKIKRAGGQVRYCPRCSARARDGVWAGSEIVTE